MSKLFVLSPVLISLLPLYILQRATLFNTARICFVVNTHKVSSSSSSSVMENISSTGAAAAAADIAESENQSSATFGMQLNAMAANNRRSADASSLTWFQIVYNTTARALIWSYFIYITCLSTIDVKPGKVLFSWHPPLMALSVK